MGIFSLFGKKGQQQRGAPAKSVSTRKNRGTSSENALPSPGTQSDARNHSYTRIARDARVATALKIDAIESEMSSEFVKPLVQPSKPTPNTHSPTHATLDSPTDTLVDTQSVFTAAAPTSDTTSLMEDAAIMFANNQTHMVEHMLCGAIEEDMLGDATMPTWWMLFDLYRITGNQQAFENLSFDFLNKFETSPPSWDAFYPTPTVDTPASVGAIPMVAFTGKLDAGNIKLIDRIQRLSKDHRVLRLEFLRITEVAPDGCDLLLRALKSLHKTGHDLILAGMAELADKIRRIIEPGRRDNTEPAWLLLMELLCLLNREEEFEQTGIDYCITFEVSPPAFVAPKSNVTADSSEHQAESENFLMPAIIEGNVEQCIASLAAYVRNRDLAIIDCSALVRVDLNAAGRLVSGLNPLCTQGKALEFHHVNHLVVALFNVMGLKDLVRIFPLKH